MLTPKQIKIFEAFLKQPYEELTYRDIKDYSNEKSNSIIQKAILKFLEDDLVSKKEIGNMYLYGLNLKNNSTFSYFDILINEKLPLIVKKTLKIIKEELANTDFFSIVIFGSYAEGKQSQKSDLDVAFFVSSEREKRECEQSLKSAELKSLLNVDYHVFTKNEMLQMLKDKQENLGKQIVHKHLAVHNPLIFYSIVQEGIDNGFKVAYPKS
ncbi:MAG: nucleotidyltransferase domain-containing protein [Nanoarchaeota archaeon]|nr:nucleotidyltransferase domain-containing protein [Nanoarchaeota archaeon]MBU1321686.1 nucleotidyltransferase domain-containing protein [Nanoarchaeota archaeon]MBU1598073.1 nucleotidyltransferase domain-containing protein [Nanoarchaeota archaeon]MBU2441635.1 nucleotidyltransferase domain-containing protein [Nanoarchaeota archaeon]